MAMGDYDLSDVAAVIGNRNGNGMFANGDGLLWLLFILILGNGWGGNRGYGGQGAGGVGGDALYPWMNLQQNFTQILQSLCGGFANVTSAVTNGFSQAEASATARAMNQMEQGFGMQTAIMGGINGLGMNMMQGFNGQQMQLAGLGAQIASEACADRQAISDGARDIVASQVALNQRTIDNQNMWGQKILDAQRDQILYEERRENDHLRQQLDKAELSASQIAQDGRIVDAVYARLRDCPVGTMPVYGMQPIFTCQGNGCGCNAA